MSCTSSLARVLHRAEYVLARKSDVWYFTALIIAVVINLVVFFSGTVDITSSIACRSSKSENCRSRPAFHWLTQGWHPSEHSRAFGLELAGPAALAVRIMSGMHLLLSFAMFIGTSAWDQLLALARSCVSCACVPGERVVVLTL
jgi:hypothetical protein